LSLASVLKQQEEKPSYKKSLTYTGIDIPVSQQQNSDITISTVIMHQDPRVTDLHLILTHFYG